MLQVQVKAACDVEMKIHEKIVTYFESCTSQVDKEGYLSKKGERKTSYQKRWCVLKGNLLFYKDRPADRDVTGVIVLEGCTIQLCESEEQFAFSLVWSEPGLRTYKFAAEDQASQESWIKALLSANHSYLALLVMDLEKKYRDALVEFSSEPANPFMPNVSTAEAGYPAAHQSTLPASLPSYLAADVGAGPSLSSNQMLQPTTISSKSASKRSPKLWPKRSANVVPVNTPALPSSDWSAVCLGTKEDFTKLHEDFGKEVKELIADWSKRGQGNDVVRDENLIDFG
ncbi:sesquipedalian-1-like isoform X1 [Anarrhichthys ocellatus]|uniref:sesquipedalian-1-like isoform X1 n=2 Tax=Anarrhichthys ocellatus TaxID=433405 RepID=UPI0012ECDB85|nr:sesquipedalian-1-like isoform X1 [Anarrhichthys ocellatus]